MADRYIDYDEISEYGRGFVNRSAVLERLTALVNVSAVRQRVLTKVVAAEGLLDKAGIQRSDLRTERQSTSGEAEALRTELERMFYFLRGQPVEVTLDLDAFYKGGVMGDVSKAKPADLVARATDVARGFDAPANQAIPGAAERKERLLAAREALAAVLDKKSSAGASSIAMTAEMVAARKDFLVAYNQIAKPAIRAVLAELGRSSEYRLFFPDLQANEGGRRSSTGGEEGEQGEEDEGGA